MRVSFLLVAFVAFCVALVHAENELENTNALSRVRIFLSV